MATYLITWNIEKKDWDDLQNVSQQIKSGDKMGIRWNCYSEKVKLGDRIFILKQGAEPKGIFGSGIVVREPYKELHYLIEKSDTFISYIDVQFDTLLVPGEDSILLTPKLPESTLWNTMRSGINIPLEFAQPLEKLWAPFTNQQPITENPKEHKNQNGAGYGDAENNVIVEQAAIHAVTKQYEENGWDVRSVERDRRGYDLVCTRKHERNDVEVKGVSASGCSFHLTYGELEQAKSNPNFVLCVVTNALKESTIHQFSGSEFLSRFEIKPVQFRASLNNP